MEDMRAIADFREHLRRRKETKLDSLRDMCELQRMADDFLIRTAHGNGPSKEELYEYHSQKVSVLEQVAEEFPDEPSFAEALTEAREQFARLRNGEMP